MRIAIAAFLALSALGRAFALTGGNTTTSEAPLRSMNVVEKTLSLDIDNGTTKVDVFTITLPPLTRQSNASVRGLQSRNVDPDVVLEVSPDAFISAQGYPVYATVANHSDILRFFQAAVRYADQQYNNGAGYNATQTYFKFSDAAYSMVMQTFDFSLFGDTAMDWNDFALAAEVLYNITAPKTSQNTSFVGVLHAQDNNTATTDILITPNFRDVEISQNLTFPTPTRENNTSTDDQTLTAFSVISPTAQISGRFERKPIDSLAGDLNRRGFRAKPHGPLGKRAGPYRIGDTGLRYSIFQATRNRIFAGMCRALAEAALTMLVAEQPGPPHYVQFDMPLTIPDIGGPLSPVFENVRFQLQAIGSSTIPRTAFIQFVKLLLHRLSPEDPSRRPLHGQILNGDGLPVASWSLGGTLEQLAYTKMVTVSGCLAENPDGSIVACIVRDEL